MRLRCVRCKVLVWLTSGRIAAVLMWIFCIFYHPRAFMFMVHSLLREEGGVNPYAKKVWLDHVLVDYGWQSQLFPGL